MHAVDRKHHIDLFFYGQGIAEIKEALRKTYPTMEFIDSAEDELIDFSDSPVLDRIKAEMNAGIRLRIRRQNKGFSQQVLSRKTGIAVSNISLMENGKRPIGAKTARTLALALNCNFAELIS